MLPRMKNNKYCPVTLEPELEEIAALWTAGRRLEAARKMRRWARQLEISAKVMFLRDRTARARPGNRPPHLPGVVRLKLILN